jgi:hypothetical protein
LQLDSTSHSLKQITTLDGHISSVKSVKVCQGKSTFIISVGGRAQLKVWKASVTSNSSLVVTLMQSNLLKGNDKKRKKTWRDQVKIANCFKNSSLTSHFTFQTLINDAETRYMDATIIQTHEENLIILTAGSDGYLRKFVYETELDRLELDEESQTCEKHAFLKIVSFEG